MAKFIKLSDLTYFGNKFATKISALFVAKEEGKGLSSNDYDDAAVEKLGKVQFITGASAGQSYNMVTVDENGNIVTVDKKTDVTDLGITKVPVSTLDGVINIDNIPKAAIERLTVVENDEARFALTIETVQLGDTVKVNETGEMYFVVDTEKLGEEAGYVQYTAGTASSVDWSGVQNVPDQIKTIEDVTEAEIDAIIAGVWTSEEGGGAA